MIQPIATHVDDALGRMLEQQKGRPNFVALLTSFVQGVQDIEDALNAMASGRYLSNAIGAQLDGIGSIVGVSRNGLLDAQYKLELLGQIAADGGNATVDSIIGVASGFFESANVSVTTLEPGSVSVSVADPQTPLSLYPLALQLLRQSLAAGVSLAGVDSYTSANSFRLAGVDPGLGLGDVNDSSIGGRLAGQIA